MKRMILSTLILCATWIFASPTPAGAHSGNGIDPTNFVFDASVVGADDISFEVVDLGNEVTIRRMGNREVIVLGYQNEPMIKIDGSGAYENTKAPSWFMNQPPEGVGTVPPDVAVSTTTPTWKRVSTSGTATYRDLRVDRLSAEETKSLPLAIRRNTNLSSWTIPIELDGRSASVVGTSTEVAPPNRTMWWLSALAFGALTIAASRVFDKRKYIAVAMACLIFVDIAHVIGLLLFGERSTGSTLLGAIVDNTYGIVVWPVGLAAAACLRQGRLELGLYIVAFSAVMVAVIGGLADTSFFSNSQLPFAFGANVGRAMVSLSLGVGLALTAIAVQILRAHAPASVDDERPDRDFTSIT